MPDLTALISFETVDIETSHFIQNGDQYSYNFENFLPYLIKQ